MTLTIAVQLVSEHANIRDSPRTLHKYLSVCSMLAIWFWGDKRVTVKELSLQRGIGKQVCADY
jgi:hypothetical protein